MKGLIVGGANSNSGKTIFTMAVLYKMMVENLDTSAFKIGPDFIDRQYLSKVLGKPGGNLDSFLMTDDGLDKAIAMNQADYFLIEGVMGYYDGISNGYEGSTFDISKKLNINSLLIYTPNGEMFTSVLKIKALVDFSDSMVKAIVLNRVSQSTYEGLKDQIEKYTGVRVIGYIKEIKGLENFLDQASISPRESIEPIYDRVLENIDYDALIASLNDFSPRFKEEESRAETKLNLSILKDESLGLYYEENIKLLEKYFNISYFSPTRDKEIGNPDLVYIGGGPLKQDFSSLSRNTSILRSIKEYGESGGYIIAEQLGLAYLTEEINEKPMVGIFRASCQVSGPLERFGYVNIDLKEDCLLGKKGRRLRGKEYHRIVCTTSMDPIFRVSKVNGSRTWSCGYKYKNVLGYLQNIHFLQDETMVKDIVDKIGGGRIVY